MNRRQFTKILLAGSTAAVVPGLLTGCVKGDNGPTETSSEKFSGKIIIAGAGAAGLYAAALLEQRGYNVTILEASGVFGGRVKRLKGFTDFDAELGAEIIRGQISKLYELSVIAKKKVVTDVTYDYVFYKNAVQREVLLGDADVAAAQAFIGSMGSYSGGDVSLSEVMAAVKIPEDVQHLVRGRLSNLAGTSPGRLGALSYAKAMQEWTAGTDKLRLKDGTFTDVLSANFQSVIDKVTYNAPVNRVDYAGEKIIVTDTAGTAYICDRLIVTVPLTQLKKNSIAFLPALPQKKLEAIDVIGMDNGIKILLKFANRFWDAKTGSIIGKGIIPEYWSTGAGGKSVDNNVLTAFVTGTEAEYISSLGGGLIQAVLQDLDSMYGVNAATNNLTDYYIQDWSKEPYIGGAYSYATPLSWNKRQDLAANVMQKIYFAGEATHLHGHFGTLHGALESSERVVSEIVLP